MNNINVITFFWIRNNKRYAQKGVSMIAVLMQPIITHHIRRQHAFSDCLIFSAKQVFNTNPHKRPCNRLHFLQSTKMDMIQQI